MFSCQASLVDDPWEVSNIDPEALLHEQSPQHLLLIPMSLCHGEPITSTACNGHWLSFQVCKVLAKADSRPAIECHKFEWIVGLEVGQWASSWTPAWIKSWEAWVWDMAVYRGLMFRAYAWSTFNLLMVWAHSFEIHVTNPYFYLYVML